jgi:hypothetical protein
MDAIKRFQLVFFSILLLTSCSNLEEMEDSSPQQISEKVKTTLDESSPGDKTVRAPPISVRAGFGAFSKGLLLGGGASFGNWFHLEAVRDVSGIWSCQIIASLQYTNLGGIYRRYDKAGIEGTAPLTLVTLDMNKQFTINSINMTETLSVALQEPFLRERIDTGFTLVITDDSGNREELAVPASYVAGFLLALEE